jgi:hypothetical protein
MKFISQQGDRIKKLEEQEKKIREITCCADSEKLPDRVSEIVKYKNKYFAEVENHEETIDKLQEEIQRREMSPSDMEKQIAEKFLEHYKETDTDMIFIGRKTGFRLINMIDHLMEGYKKLEKEAKAWNIINHGADWENIRDLCDEEMCKALIETGECDKEDFEGYSYEPK